MPQKSDSTSPTRLAAYAAVVLGAVLAAGALLADVIGIGGGGEGIGWKQLIAAIVGIVIFLQVWRCS
ncbi:hypothetical protein BH23CHL5_BH23CHL5_19410 [soil metagenome]